MLLLLLSFTALAGTLHAQAPICTSPTVAVLNQSNADLFDCTEVENLYISNGGGDLTNIVGLSGLTRVNGFLKIENTVALESLAGLDSLTFVGGDVVIGTTTFGGNAALLTLDGLSGLTTVGGDLEVIANTGLESLSGLNHVSTVGGQLVIQANPSLVSVSGLSGLTVADRLVLRQNGALQTLDGLQALATLDVLDIGDNDQLQDISALGSLSSARAVSIRGNELLASLHGLEGLTSIDELQLFGAGFEGGTALTSLSGLDNLAVVQGISISGCNNLLSLEGLSSLTTASRVQINGNGSLASLHGLESLTGHVDRLAISSNSSLASLDAIGGVASIGVIDLAGNDALPSLGALSNLVSLGSLYLTGNHSLHDLSGLEHITELAQLTVDFTSLRSLDGLNNLTSTSDVLQILDNDELTSLEALESLTSVGGSLFVNYNDALESLGGLDRLVNVGQQAIFVENSKLADCTCGLRGLISGDPQQFTGIVGDVTIADNLSSGQCNSVPDVLAIPVSACQIATPVADVSIDKSASRNPAVVEEPLTYTLTVTNGGPDEASGVEVTDALSSLVQLSTFQTSQGSCVASGQTVACSLGSIVPGGSATVEIQVFPNSAGDLVNTASVWAVEDDPVTSNNESTVESRVIDFGEECRPVDDPSWDGSVVALGGLKYFRLLAPRGHNVIESYNSHWFAVHGVYSADGSVELGPGGTGDFSETFTNAPNEGDVIYRFIGSADAPTDVLLRVAPSSDAPPNSASRFFIRLDDAGNDCAVIDIDPVIAPAIDGESDNTFFLDAAYPNPFADGATVSFGITNPGNVSLIVYDAIGRETRRLVDAVLGAGRHAVVWDGLDARGLPVADGIYFYRLLSIEGTRTGSLTRVTK
ncbi:MAG: hypothetical protein R2832_09885 [Rhodothermales bacterium]